MSAFLCSNDLIDLLVSCYFNGPRDSTHLYLKYKGIHNATEKNAPQLVRDALIDENWRSIQHCYEDAEDYCGAHYRSLKATKFRRIVLLPQPGVIATASRCLSYQSCEHPGWESSPAFKILQDLNSKLLKNLPGYDLPEGWDAYERPKNDAVCLSTLVKK
jgi:hypothetical protein